MTRCPHCGKHYSFLQKHLGQGCTVLKQLPSATKKKRRRSLFSHAPPKSNHKTIRQHTSTQEIELSLSTDTHCAPKSIVSDQLVNIPSIRDRANTTRIQNQINKEANDDTSFSPSDTFDNPPSDIFDDQPTDNKHLLPNKQQHKLNEQKATWSDTDDSSYMQRFLNYIDTNASDPFDPEKCDEDKIEFLESSYKSVGKLPDFMLAQIDLLRLLNRSGCSLSMYDKIIKWVLHYSEKNPRGTFG